MSAEEITKRIYEDLQDALSVVAENIENPALAIEKINVRVGEKSSHIATVDDLDPSPFSSKNGWVIDAEFSPFHLKKKTDQTFKTVSVFPLFKALPVSSIKGIGDIWTKRLQGANFKTIGTFREAKDIQVHSLCETYHAISPLSFWQKVVALDRKIPMELVADFGHIDLYALMKKHMEDIFASYTDTLMREMMFQFLSACADSIDAHMLETISLNTL